MTTPLESFGPSSISPNPDAFPSDGSSIVLDGFFDESGTHGGSETIAVAGFILLPEERRVFEKKWNAALNEYGLEFFHMSEFSQSRAGSKYDWPDEMRRQRLGHLISIINEHTLLNYGLGIPKKLYESVFTWRVREKLGGPYGFVTWLLIAMVAKDLDALAGQFLPNIGVAYVFEDGAAGKGELLTAFDDAARIPTMKKALHLESLTLGDKPEFAPLQAADILAYELYKDRPLQDQPERRRMPLQLIRRGTWSQMTEGNLRAYAAVMDMWMSGEITAEVALSAAIWRPPGEMKP